MTYLLSISIGPVQEFIAAARRTADLHAGSRLLQRVVDAAAETIPAAPGAAWSVGRIFPVQIGAGGSNKILALTDTPAETAATAKQAAMAALFDAWHEALDVMGSTARSLINMPLANRQIDQFLEVYAAWVPATEDSYPSARLEVEALLAGTKAVRVFPQQPGDDAQIANSGLDPSRPSVVTGAQRYTVPKALVDKSPLWLKSTELMDAISLTKRALSAQGSSTRLGAVLSTRDLAMRSREPGYKSASDIEPAFPYFAVLVADGDRMGEQLGRHTTPATHRLLAEKLDAFSVRAAADVAATDGQLVYAGGDDVLALVPVVRVIDCAEKLANSFAEFVPGATLSVGAAIGHYKEPLSVTLAHARDAERAAKVDRNSLAVGVYKRAGNPVLHEEQWTLREDAQDRPPLHAAGLSTWLCHYGENRVSHSLAFALRQLALEFPRDKAEGGVLSAEVARIIRHSESDPVIVNSVPPIESVAALDGFVELLVVSRFLAGVERG